ncbi:preprotein translocase subunit YajC [Roseovarius pacificus]|uniref:preprotein translocase subunit YajC n=1 Tax=Roseovarius pacificus TaxID=337701 RepID=UPI002A188154|nr:preprotein translocase subunit YajC [Roseovarius pacificus]
MWWYVHVAAQAFAQNAPTAPVPADGGGGGGGEAPGMPPGCAGGGLGGLLPFILIMIVMMFLLTWPRQREEKKRKALLNALQKGDSVVTIGGVCGTIQGLSEEYAVLKLDDGVTVKFLRSAVARVASAEEKK